VVVVILLQHQIRGVNLGMNMIGTIIKINCDIHNVLCDNKIYSCKCRGIFRHKHIVPLVGDTVEINEKDCMIEKVLPRRNEFLRPPVSNIDQGILITSLKSPNFSFFLLDKLLILMELHHCQSIICITKVDLLNKLEQEKIKPYLEYYQKIGYPVVFNTDIFQIKKILNHKTSVFTGQTGAGKSTLLNRLNPDWNLKVGEISLSLGRGKHTTRMTELFLLDDGKVLDTPGFSALEFQEYSDEQIREAFIEFENYPCPFKDCSHTNEGECAVKAAVEDKKILESRYQSYLKLLERRF